MIGETIVRMDRAAARYPESTPLGNGRIGAMLYGDIEKETIVLNEKGMWSGSPEDSDRPDAHRYLPEIRQRLLGGDNSGAEALVREHFVCKGQGSGYAKGARIPFGCYQMLGYLRLYFFQYSSLGSGDEGVSGYQRTLDAGDAVARVEYDHHGVHYAREGFVSAPDQVFALQISADAPGRVSFNAQLDRPECFSVSPDGGDLVLSGQLPDGFDTDRGVRFACRLRIVPRGGRLWREGNTLHVQGADSALILIAAITDIRSFAGRRADDPALETRRDIDRAAAVPYDQLLSRHVAEYRGYYGRMTFALDAPQGPASELGAIERIRRLRAGARDPGLETLLFNFDRYLFISANRPGELPGNLQGLWAEEIQTPWNGDWHLNAQQMLFWAAEICNLPELHLPWLEMTRALVEPGAKTARCYYGARGWVAHTFTNAWRFTSPGEDAAWGSTTGSPAWQCFHLWDHYLHHPDRAYLEWAYPVMKGAAEFYLDMLVEEPSHGWLVTAPSDSPENLFIAPDGERCAVCMGPTYDNQMLRFLFPALIAASRALGVDEAERAGWARALDRLPPTRVGPDGRIMEWLEPYEEALPNHRHISHLWGLYPGHEITPDGAPELARAAARSLEARGTTSAGWSISHRFGAWARLGEGDEAHRCFLKILRDATYPNLFARCYHAPENDPDPEIPPVDDYFHPFQMDANSGVAGCLPEMIAQGRVTDDLASATVALLPALPAAWPGGKLSGIALPGALTADVEWKDGALKAARIRPGMDLALDVMYREKRASLRTRPGEVITLNEKLEVVPDEAV